MKTISDSFILYLAFQFLNQFQNIPSIQPDNQLTTKTTTPWMSTQGRMGLACLLLSKHFFGFPFCSSMKVFMSVNVHVRMCVCVCMFYGSKAHCVCSCVHITTKDHGWVGLLRRQRVLKSSLCTLLFVPLWLVGNKEQWGIDV